MSDLQKYVDGIADDLKKLYEADYTDEEREEKEENGEAVDLYSYFEDALDWEYTIDRQGDYIGVKVWVTLGGPNVAVDTRNGVVSGAWGCDRCTAWLPSEICDEIDNIFSEYYDCSKC